MEVHDPRFFARLARSGRLAVGEGYQAGEWSSPDLPGPRGAARAQSGAGLRPAAALAARRARAPRPAHRAAARPAPRRARRARALRPRQRVLLALAGRLDDLLLRALRVARARRSPRRSRRSTARSRTRRASARTTACSRSASGWGGFALHLARERGCRVTTATISREQHALATERVREAGLGDRIDVVYSDYRQLAGLVHAHRLGRDDRGHRAPATRHLLRDDRPPARAGRPRRHPVDPRARPALPTPTAGQRDWIRKHIFPGGMLPSLEAITTAARRSSGLMVHDVREIGPHYARTLREWRERFLAAPRRGRRAGARRPLPAHLGVLPRVLRGGLRDARAARRAARAHAAAQPHALAA